MNIRMLLLLTLSVSNISLAQVPYAGNDSDHGVTAAGFPNAYTGNVSFSTRDLVVAGAVGELGLSWQRYGTSRTSQNSRLFGAGHNWTHNWQWEMVAEGSDSQGRSVISVREPSGVVHRFAETSAGQWGSTPNVTDRVVSSGDVFTLQQRGGREARFIRQSTPQGDVFTLRSLTDGQGNVWTLNHSGGQLVQVTEPAGRWLKISYKSLQAPGAPEGFPTYAVISNVMASDGQSVTYHYEFPAKADYPVLIKATYPDAYTATYRYDEPRPGARVLLTQADDPRGDHSLRGRAFRYRSELDAALGQILEISAIDGGTVIQALAADPRELRAYALTQANGLNTYQVHNPGGNVAETVDALGFARKYEYDSTGRGRLIALADELGSVTRYEYDAAGNIIKATFPDKSSRSWRHDAKGRVTAETNELGHTRTFDFDAKGRVIRSKDASGAVEETTYNAFGQIVTKKDRGGGITKYAYDERGLRVAVTDALGHLTQLRYDRSDNVSEVVDARGFSTKAEHDLQGRLNKAIYPDGSAEIFKYSAYGDLLESTAPDCEKCSSKSYSYDEFGRRIQAKDAMGNIARWEYAAFGTGAPFNQFVRSISPEGKVLEVQFDANGRVTARTLAAGARDAATTRYVYDAAGRQTSVVNPAGRSLQVFHDVRGRVVKAMGALNNATTFAYDAAGRKIIETDAKGNTIKWTYDAEGRELTKTDAANQVTRREYDGAGRLLALIDAKGNTTRFEYDAVSRQTAAIYSDGSKEVTAYDEVGNEKSYTNRAGATRAFTYDNRNREILSEWSDGSQRVVKAYDSEGRMTLEDNGISKLTFVYDKAGQLLSETQDLYPVVTGGENNPTPRTMRYGYTKDGQRASVTYPDGSALRLAYNARNQLQAIADDTGSAPIASYEYDLVGNATRMPRENLTETSADYDAENKLTRIVERDRARSPISALDYGYDDVGNRTSRTESSGQGPARDTYHFDNTYQVVGADYAVPLSPSGAQVGPPTGTVRLAYDAVGNRLQVSSDGKITRYAVNSLNQYTQVGQFAPKYDANGNLGSMGEWIYRYDAMNRLVEATNGKVSAKLFYDARNRAVARVYNGQTTLNTYDDWNLVEELDASGRQQARYVHGRRTDEVVVMVNQHGTFYPHHDALGNVVMLTDANGEVVEKYDYAVDGQVTIKDKGDKVLSGSAVGNRWAFTGREWLAEVGLYDYRNRVYSSELGRFLQTDPIKFRAGDVNIYRYVGNRLLNFTDPSGLVCGNGTWGDYFVPDGIPGVFTASSACGIHDDIYADGIYNGQTMVIGANFIYSGYSYTQSQADSFFLNRMLDTNNNIFGYTFSYIYYSVVRLFGWLFWGGE